MENTKEQVVAEWKAINEPRLKEIKSANPDLYSAINLALNYLNKKLGGDELPVEVEELPFKVGDVFRRNLSTDIPPNTEITYTVTQIGENEVGLYVDFLAGNKNKPRNVFKKIEDVVEDIEAGWWVLYEGSPIETKQWTREDFLNTKIKFSNENENKKFQELLFSLGFNWGNTKSKKIEYTKVNYIYVEPTGTLLFGNGESTFNDSVNREIFYDDIFPSKTKNTVWRFKTQEEIDLQGDTNNMLGIEPNEFRSFIGKPLSEIMSPIMYADEAEAIKELKKDKLQIGKRSWEISKRFFTTEPLPTKSTVAEVTQAEESKYTWPVETYPAKLKYSNVNINFEPNEGDRKSPTQSAGRLKRKVSQMGQANEIAKMVLDTKFKGNDGNWYAINVNKAGTWTWKETTPPPAQSTSSNNDLSKMSDAELLKLYSEIEEAKNELDSSDPEFTELRLQQIEVSNELDKRN